MKHLPRILLFLWIAWKDVNCENVISSHSNKIPEFDLSPNTISYESIVNAFDEVSRNGKEKKNYAKRNDDDLPNDIPRARHCVYQNLNTKPNYLDGMGTFQAKIEKAMKILKAGHNVTVKQIEETLNQFDLHRLVPTIENQACPGQNITNCNRNSRYRTLDGSCNNLRNPAWGMASNCYARIMDAVYDDGISEIRRAVSGRDLPLPRRVSLEIHSHMDYPSHYVNHMFMQWGQFIIHDMEQAPFEQTSENEFLVCCPVRNNNNRQCAPIIVPPNDPFYTPLGVDCVENSRSTICPTCRSGARQQTNQVTSFLDGSVIYGSSSDVNNRLRTRRNGLLKTQPNNLLPESDIPNNDLCSFQRQDRRCFLSGDTRVNTHPALTSLHTVFLRHHNHIAMKLREINSRWSDERLFQEARKIVGAQFQVITYGEYLPYVLGPERMRYFHLNINNDRSCTYYDSRVDPTILNEFAVGAGRFGHSQINSFFPQIPRQGSSADRLRDMFFWPFDLYNQGYLEGMLRGLVRSSAQKFDRHMVTDVTNHLFQFRGNQSGLDLAALDVLRGRDHGVPTYVNMVRYCGGPRINNFYDLDQLFQRGYRQRFQAVYQSVYDIDFFSGGLAEVPIPDAVVGPTFAYVIGMQFNHLKYGDRFYFEHDGQAGSFTRDQVAELKKTSLAKIICDNTYIEYIQRDAMLYRGDRNPEIRCSSISEPNLWYWRE